jgi:hypothetical protein
MYPQLRVEALVEPSVQRKQLKQLIVRSKESTEQLGRFRNALVSFGRASGTINTLPNV